MQEGEVSSPSAFEKQMRVICGCILVACGFFEMTRFVFLCVWVGVGGRLKLVLILIRTKTLGTAR